MSDFETIFDLTKAGYNTWWAPAVGVIMLFVFLASLVSPAVARRLLPSGYGPRWFPFLLVAFLMFWIVLTAAATFGSISTSSTTLQADEFAP